MWSTDPLTIVQPVRLALPAVMVSNEGAFADGRLLEASVLDEVRVRRDGHRADAQHRQRLCEQHPGSEDGQEAAEDGACTRLRRRTTGAGHAGRMTGAE